MRTKNSTFSKIGFLAIIVVLLAICFTALCFNKPVSTYAEDIPFALYKNGEKVGFKNNEHFVLGTSDGLSLVFSEVINEEVQIVVDGKEYSLSDDKKTVDLSGIEGNVSLTVTIHYEKVSTYSHTISIGWTALESYEGVYYLPGENGWRVPNDDSAIFKSQDSNRFTASSMRIVTKNIEYLSLSATAVDAADNWTSTLGKAYTSSNSYSIGGAMKGNTPQESNYKKCSFVLDYSFDIITIEYKPQSTDDKYEDSAEMIVKNLSLEPEYVTLSATFNSEIGRIYYYNQKGEKVCLAEGDNQILKNLKTAFYFESAIADEEVRVFEYLFKCGTYSLYTDSFSDGMDTYSRTCYVQEDAIISASFKVCLKLPQENSSINKKENGVFTLMTVNNGGVYYFDREIPVEVTVMAPALGVQETCKLYINGKLHTELVSAANLYAYTFGELDYDRTFTFVYSKEGDYHPTQFEYTLKKITTKTIEEDLISEESSKITLSNDENYPYGYYSPISLDRVGYVPGNVGSFNTMSSIKFTVYESGSFVFNYYMNTDNYTYCLLSIGEPIDFGNVDDDDFDSIYGIGEPYSTYDKEEANHGVHGWRKKTVDVAVDGDGKDIYIYYIKIKPYDSYTDETEGMFGIAEIAYYVGNATYTQDLRFSDSGNFTAEVDGIGIDNGATFPVGTSITLSATPNDGNIFYGWIINGELVSSEKDYTFVLVKDALVECVMQEPAYYVAKDNKNFYTSLNEAVRASSESRTIYLINDTTLIEDLVIPSNIKVLIPYDEEDITGLALGNVGIASSQVSWANPQKYLYLTLTVDRGVSLVINGEFVLGGVLFYPDQSAQGHTSGAYSQIVNEGTIILDSGAYLDVNGLITGSGEIVANARSTINMPFIVNNFSGGSITLSYYTYNCFPFYNYALINIQCTYTIKYQAKLVGAAALFFSGAINTQDIVVINSEDQRNENLDGALFWITEGASITLSYENKSVNALMGEAHIEDSGVTTMTFHGNILFGEFSMQGFGSTQMVLGLPYTFNYVVASDGVLTVPQGREYMLMPGSKILVNVGGVFDIDGGIYVYDGLIQAPLAKKYYPTVEQLRASGFDVSGMFINNGTTNINGGFAGIIQSTVSGAVVNVKKNALLSKTIEIGGEYGGTNNRAQLSLTARVSGINNGELTILEDGKSYKSYELTAGTEFTLDTFTMDYANYCSEISATLNQKMSGSYGIVNGDNIEVSRTLSIGAEYKDVVIRVNGTIYQTDDNGEISLMLPINSEISYQSVLLDKLLRSINSWNDLSTIVLVVPKSVVGNASSANDLIYNADGSVRQALVVKGIVTFYNGESEEIELSYTLNNSYVQEITFESDAYVIDYSDKVYVQKAVLTEYLENVLSLENATNVVEKATELYQQYNRLLNGLSSEEVSYVTSRISSECGDWAGYQEIVGSFNVSGVTYGDDVAQGEGTSLNGSKKTISLTVGNDYTVEGGNIYVTFTYSSSFNGKAYSVEKRSGVNRKALSVVADPKTSVYGKEIVALTATTNGLVPGDIPSDVYTLTKQSGSDVGEYNITINKNGTKAAYYEISYTDAKYSITVKDIEVSLTANNVMLYKANTLKVIVDFGSYQSIPYTINVLSDNSIVARYSNGTMKLEMGFSFSVGEYTLQAVNENANYNLVQVSPCTYSVVDNKDYYLFDVNLSGSKVYDGLSESLTVSVKVSDTEESVGYNIRVNGSRSYDIKNAGEYSISVEVEGYTYTTSYSITAKPISVNWEDVSYYYNGLEQSPDYTLVGVVEGESVILSLGSYVDAANYEIIPSIENGNYKLEESVHTFVINPKEVTIAVNSILDIRLSTIVSGSRMFFTVTQTDSDISSSNLRYTCYDSNGNKAFTVDSNGIVGDIADIAVGTHKVFAECTDTNYSVTCTPAEFSIVEDNNYYTLTVKFNGGDAAEKVYDGERVMVTVAVVVTETQEEVTDVAVEYFVNDTKVNSMINAADYTIKVTVDSEITYVYNYRITQRELELEWIVDEYIYNGEEQYPEVSAVNVVGGDIVNPVLSNGEYVNAGRKSIKVIGIEGDDCSNYKLPQSVEVSFEIEAMTAELGFMVYDVLYGKIEQTLAVTDIENDYELDLDKVYYDIFKGEELVGSIRGANELTLNRTLELGDYIVYPISLDSNYIIESDGISFSVVESKDYYSVDLGIFSLSKTYDGNEVELSVTAKVAQTRKPVECTVAVNGSEEYSICKAGNYSIVVSLLGGSFEYEYVVEKKAAQISWGGADFTYNGSSQIPEVSVSNKGLDDVSVELNDFDSVSAGFKSVSVKSLTGTDKDNYKLSSGLSNTYTIKSLEIDLTFGDIETFYGEEKEITYYVGKDIPDALSSVVIVTREQGITVGSYAISVDLINNNYTVNVPKASFEIKPRAITVLVDSKSAIYGEDAQELSAVIQGNLAYEDTAFDIYELAREEGIVVGEYRIYGIAKNDNYSVTFVNATYTVKARKLEFLVKDVSVIYGDEEKSLEAELKDGFSFAYNDAIGDVLTLSREEGVNAGDYKITASVLDNSNYNVAVITYTNPENSLYRISKRELTITLFDKKCEDVESFENVRAELDRNPYAITEGELVDGDNLSIDIVLIYQGKDVELSEDNFDSYYIAGEHVITLTYSNDNYDVKVVNGTLTVTKAAINVVGIVTDYVYDDGKSIEVFDWRKNIEGNLKRADEKAFKLLIKNSKGEELESITEVGEYTITIIINYKTYFDFAEDAVTEYKINVAKKDISETLIAAGIPEEGVREYDPYADDVYAECTKEGIKVNYEIFKDGIESSDYLSVGSYSIKITIDDLNYKGEASYEWKVVVKDISKEITINGVYDNAIKVLGQLDISGTLPKKYKNVDLEVKYFDVNGEEVEDLSCGTYRVVVTVKDGNYIGEKKVSFKVIGNYDELFAKLKELIAKCKEGTAEEKLSALSEARLALKSIKAEELDDVKSIYEYKSVLDALQEEFTSFGNKVDEVANTARGENLLLVIEMWNAFMLMTYMGIKKTL